MKKIKEESVTNIAVKYPPELKCPYGDHIVRDAVLVPCCGHFFCCDSCIREKISNDGIEAIECPHENCTEIGSLGSITPFHEIRKKVNDYLNDMKLANQRQSSNTTDANTNSDDVDPFFDLILNDVVSETTTKIELTSNFDIMDSLTKSFDLDKDDETEKEDDTDTSNKNSPQLSPLQDSKISSSLNSAANLPPFSIPPPVASASAASENSIQIIQPNISISNSNFHIQPPPFNNQRAQLPPIQPHGYINEMSYNSQAFIHNKYEIIFIST